jgi:hypothetical protein
VNGVKRGLIRATYVFAICVPAILWTCLPAMAKGPSQGVITGPGLEDPIRLREPGATTTGFNFERLVERSGFFVGLWGAHDRGRLAGRPPGNLGPRYTITYAMGSPRRHPDRIIQYVFPFAEPQPITYVPANQTYWGSSETVGAWFAARIGFTRTLLRLGLPASGSFERSTGRDEPTAAVSHASSNPTRFIAAAVVLVLGLAGILRGRRRSETAGR